MIALPSIEEIGFEIGHDPELWDGECHGVSLAIVKAGIVEGGRVARGWADGVRSQHSWIIVGDEPYDWHTWIVDPTLWTYRDDVEGIWQGRMHAGLHYPHGYGDIWAEGRPSPPEEEPIELPTDGLSPDARLFLDILGPLDLKGWSTLVNGPMMGWPSKEIIARVCEVPELSPRVPIDIEGMLTERNPGGLYW